MTTKNYVTWEQIFTRLSKIDKPENVVYGIPKGGMILTAFLKHAKVVHLPECANVILDDIVDTGNTMNFYAKAYPNALQYALFDRKTSKEDYTYFKNKWLVFPWEVTPMAEDTVQQNIVRTLEYIGEDPKREGLLDTPNRVVKSWSKIFEGYQKDPKEIFTCFESDGYDQIVLLKDIEVYSMCEHHMLPFFGKAHVAYIPDGKVVGISKLARLVDIFARRLQIQERICEQVTDALIQNLNPKGAACIIEAKHMCMCMRGVEKQNSTMSTSSLKGIFLTDSAAKNELIQLIKL
jgi:GTP cyclohydrolase I